MTTAPRKQPTIKKSIESVSRAGLPEPIIFAEPESYLTEDMKYLLHTEKKGVWHNWLEAARHAIYLDTPYVLTLQDDIEMHPDTAQLIQELIPFRDEVGCVSLYASHIYGSSPGIFRIRSGGFWGSLAMLFRTDVLRAITQNVIGINWKGIHAAANSSEIIDDDLAIGRIIRNLKLNMYGVLPSPVVHTGHTSSIVKPHVSLGYRNTLLPSDFNKPLMEQIPQDTLSLVSLCYEPKPVSTRTRTIRNTSKSKRVVP